MMAFKYLQWNPKVLSLEINSSETNIITAGNNGRDMNVLTLTTDRSNVIRHVYLGTVLFPLPKDMCSTVTRAWKTGHRRPRSSACEYGNFFPPCSAKSWSAHNNVRPHLWSRRKRNNLSKRWRHDWSIYQRELCKKDDKPYFELGTVRGSREVTKSTIIIHDFMCWQNEIKYNQTTWNNCSVMQRLSKSQLFFRTVFNAKRQKQDNVNSQTCTNYGL